MLSYIANQDKRFQTFVANRITTIHDGSRPNQWIYVETGSNPADDASRGLFAEEFIQNKRWMNGPAFLWEKEDHWRRWIREYLPQLQERQKWFYPSRYFAVNDVVLVVDDRVTRSSWPLGRVTSVHKNSKDGRVRSVTVKTRTSVYDRPVDKIVLLESVEMSEDTKL